jgi:hypothetical protein
MEAAAIVLGGRPKREGDFIYDPFFASELVNYQVSPAE